MCIYSNLLFCFRNSFLLALIQNTLAEEIYCNDPNAPPTECTQQINDNRSSNLFVIGYNSTKPLKNIEYWNRTECSGAFSCYNANWIHSDTLHCSGAASCLHSPAGDRHANIIVSGTKAFSSPDAISSSIYCNADQSCANSSIKFESVIVANGAYSLLYSNVWSVADTHAIFHIRGYYAAYGAKLRCATVQCDLYCYGKTACLMTYIYGGTWRLHTDSEDAASPITNISEFHPNSDVLLYDSASNTMDNNALCSLQKQTNDTGIFDNYEELKQPILWEESRGPICCRAVGSCKFDRRLDNPLTQNDPIICSGALACRYTSLQAIGDIFCSGLIFMHCVNVYLECESPKTKRAKRNICFASAS